MVHLNYFLTSFTVYLSIKRQLNYSKDRSKILFERKGDLVIRNVKTGQENMLTSTIELESNPGFIKDESGVIFQRGDNLCKIIVNGGTLTQLSNFTRTRKRADVPLSKQDEWLKQDQLNELEIKDTIYNISTKELPGIKDLPDYVKDYQ